ncbi:sugar ABC transporter ATP-binding protein [Chakrabartyella piscis]|uniref:sugar ABC transporter ATP-binding protein n=1 Tax=Chakrabartyella piscis TaxID=2918914 RepID=UPI002958C04D|nr:sugar ABC transporter ATP-binding protein [Chakrabartyella piscis]
MENVALQLNHIYKSFGGVHALTDMDLTFKKGEITGLCGSNGAGKSTLLNIIFGVYEQDKGEIYVDGKELKKNSPIIAQESGMSIIFQHRRLMKHMTVAENIFIDKMPKKGGKIDFAKMEADARSLLEELELDIDPKVNVSELTTEESQLVEIVKAYAKNPSIFLMDEPTSALRQHGVEMMFSIMRKLKEKGAAVVFISHRLKEVLDICDNITVIKDGTFVVTDKTENFTASSLVDAMSGDIGKKMDDVLKNAEGGIIKQDIPLADRIVEDELLVEVTDLVTDEVSDFNFQVHPGEIVGFVGLGGSGVQNVFDHLFGMEPRTSGSIKVKGKEVNFKNPIQAIRAGVGYVPEDRQLYGEFLDMTIQDNIGITKGQKNPYFSKIKAAAEKVATNEYIQTLGIKTPSGDVHISSLSGGNQQKAIIAKWLYSDVDLFILNEPTAGIDVAAKTEMIEFIKKLSCEGKGILYTTSYITELIDVSDRIFVVYKGKILREYQKSEFDYNRIFLGINGIEE